MRTLFCGLVIIGKTLLLAAAITADNLNFVDPLIGTEGSGSEYGGMQPYTKVETLDAKPYLTRMGCVHLLRANVHAAELLMRSAPLIT